MAGGMASGPTSELWRNMKRRVFSAMPVATFTITVALMICAGTSQAAETKISGTISTTVTLTRDSELMGDVTCKVRQFRLNLGHPGGVVAFQEFDMTHMCSFPAREPRIPTLREKLRGLILLVVIVEV